MLTQEVCRKKLGLWSGIVMFSLIFCLASQQNATAKPVALQPANAIPKVLDLSRSWRLALQYDHTYLAAISEQAASQTERNQGRAGLLPQVQAGYVRSKVRGDSTQRGFFGQSVNSRLDYDSSNAYVQLQQPLVNYGRYADYQRGKARADLGTAVFEVKRHETGIRLATAYFNVLLAYDSLLLQRSLTASLQNQVVGAEARYRANAGTRIEVQETQARLAVVRADLIEANDGLTMAGRELEALLGAAPTEISALREGFPLLVLTPDSLGEWLGRARAYSAQVQSARKAVDVADAEVDQAASRYLPTADLVAVYSKANSENLSSLSQRSNTFSIGIQVNIPIFTGGYNTANVAQARSDRMRLQYELNAVLEQIQAEVTRQYTNVRGGADRIQALETAVASNQLSLDSIRKGFELGMSSNLDVLNAQDRLYQAKYDLVKTRLEYLLAHLKLAAAAGDLHSGRLDQINDTYLGKTISLMNFGLVQ